MLTSGPDIDWGNYQEHSGLDGPSWKGSQDLSMITWLMGQGLICIHTYYLNTCDSPTWSLRISPSLHCWVLHYNHWIFTTDLGGLFWDMSDLLDKVLYFMIKKIFGVIKTPWPSWRRSTIPTSKCRENFHDGLENSSPSQSLLDYSHRELVGPSLPCALSILTVFPTVCSNDSWSPWILQFYPKLGKSCRIVASAHYSPLSPQRSFLDFCYTYLLCHTLPSLAPHSS